MQTRGLRGWRLDGFSHRCKGLNVTTRSLFETTPVGAWTLSNRVVMAPLTRNRAPGAQPTALMAQYYAQRASAGLIVTEATAVSHQAQGYADVPGIWQDEQVQGWRAVTDAVHAAGGRIVVQLWHVGRISHVSLQPGGAAPVAPSAIRANSKTVLIDAAGAAQFVDVSEPRALRADELAGIVADYAHAARQAMAAGFDGVEIHGANGYLLDQFLKTGANQRADEFGGSVAHRMRFPLWVVQAVCDAIGADRVGIRLSPNTPANDIHDDQPQPLFEALVNALAPLGLAYLHLIEGSTGGPRELPERPFDFWRLHDAYRAAGGQGAWMVNNGYTLELAQQALAQGADLVCFGRSFISNPDLVHRLKVGAPLAKANRATFYGGGAEGYTDYPVWQG
jgi:N-ethylmaleimide reductase